MERYFCKSCGYKNPTNNVNFCSDCGQQLVQTCTSCGQNNPSNFNFCSYCGTSFDKHQNFQVLKVKQITYDSTNVEQNGKGDNNIRLDKPFQAPPLPKYYIDRPEYSQKLKKRLLTESENALTLVVTVIHGLSAIGKSILTTGLAHDTEVQARFSDGILWATLGHEPNLLSLLSGWVQALGDYNFKATNVEATSDHLRTLLYDKQVLLVVDDARNIEDAQAFNVGGAKCQVLVTTRLEEIALKEASKYSINVMKPEQAMELLTKKLGRNLDDTEIHDAEILAALVGYLPLALDLIAALANCTSWKFLLQNMRQEVDDEISLKHSSLTALFNLSVQQLSEETRENFIWLGILAENVNITQKMVVTLWDMDSSSSAGDELRYLYSKALLLPGVPLPDETPTYRLHDLFYDLARNLLTAKEKHKGGNLSGNGKTLRVAHATFLDKYRHLISNNLWHTLPNDGYIHQHLVWHLEKAQKIEEIHKLLRSESETGGNGWYEACEKLGQAANFVTDVRRALKLAEDDKHSNANMSSIIGLQCRYALIIASLNSLAADLPAELLIALVHKEVWTKEQGLAHVLQSSKKEQKAKSLIKLANYLPSRLKELALSKALAAARQIQDEYSRADALSSLADKLPRELLSSAPTAVKQIEDKCRADTLSSLIDKLPRELLPEALAAVRQIPDEYYRAEALSSLVNKLPEILPEALAAARQIPDEYYRDCIISSLVNKLSQELLSEALTAARQIQDEYYRAKALSSLADKLPEILPEALAATRQIQDEYYRDCVLNSLADKLPQELLPEALAAARQIQDEYYRDCALSSLADKLPQDLLPQASAVARQIQPDKYYRADILSSLADKLVQIQKTELFSHWRDTLYILSLRTRPHLLRDINALTPVIFILGGEQAVKDTACAIQDVSRWWF